MQRSQPRPDPTPNLTARSDYVVLEDRYHLLETLGAGAFGRVYEAHDATLDRTVAIKTVPVGPRASTAPREHENALAEARTIAKLDHPHIVPVYDAGVYDDGVWMAMKRIRGRSLADLLDERGSLPTAETLHILHQVSQALDHAHRRGVVHRDVKPSNILLADDHAWLTDFGIAKVLTGRTTESERAVVGTPHYMAPEQIRGERVDARTDVFSLGCVTMECLTGRRAFRGDTFTEVLYSIVHESPQGLAEIGSLLGPDAASALRRWLAKSPEDRRQSMAEVLRDLDTALRGHRSNSSRRLLAALLPWATRQSARWDGRHPLVAEGLTKGYGFRNPVLDDLNLEIPTGSFYALLGRNGSGKTTLIRTLLGFYRPDRGSVRVFGQDPSRREHEILRRVGFVPDTLHAYEWLEVGDLLEMLQPYYPEWDRSYCYRLLERFDLPLDVPIRSLSRGMKHKVSLVAALSPRPQLLVLDDPTLGLDAVVLAELMDTLEELSRQEGITILFASHEHELIERFATHVGFLRGGRLLLSERLEQLKMRAREVHLTFQDEVPDVTGIDQFRIVRSSGRRITGVVLDVSSGALRDLENLGAEEVEVRELPLRQIFVSYLR